jgi:hypothetical protein
MRLSIIAPRPYMRYYTAYCLGLCLVFVTVDAAVFRTKLFDTHSLVPDGAYWQYLHIRDLIQNGTLGGEVSENPILLMHLFRYAIYWPFIILQEANTGLQYTLLTVIAFPVINHYFSRPSHLVFFFPLMLAYFISYRSVLAMISVGYIVIYMFDNRKPLFLFAGLLLSALSTAVFIQSLALLLSYVFFRARRMLFHPLFICAMIMLVFFLFKIMAEKYAGFSAGTAGYQSLVLNADTIVLLKIVSRSTIFVSILQGQARGYVYIGLAVFVVLLIFKTFLSRDPRIKNHKLVLLAMFPGFFAEGLGVLSITLVFLWTLLKVDFERSSTRLRRTKVVRDINGSDFA